MDVAQHQVNTTLHQLLSSLRGVGGELHLVVGLEDPARDGPGRVLIVDHEDA
jgi:hypothetical protein